MNKKGFAVSGIIYTLMILFIILIIALLAMFNDRKNLLDELRKRVLNNVNTYEQVSDITYKAKDLDANLEYFEYTVKLKGYYDFELASVSGNTLKTKFYLKEGEKLYIKVGSEFNSDSSNIYYGDDKKLLMSISNGNSEKIKYETKEFENRIFINTEVKKDTNITEAYVKISYSNNKKQNLNLNKVRYIKDCLYSNSQDDINEWFEIKAIKNGENRAFEANVTGDAIDPKLLVDGDITTFSISTLLKEENACVIVDLGRTYDLDYISTWHNYTDERIYFERKLMVSSDNKKYRTIDKDEVRESINGIDVSSFEPAKTILIGDVYLPIKEFSNSKWIRIFHHNNRNGTVLWDAKAQVMADNGYSTYYKESALYYLNNLIKNNGTYEFMLEYPLEDDKYNRWVQTSDITVHSTINGYMPINIQYTPQNALFDGLKYNGSSDSIISGSTGLYYSIGALKSSDNGILGPGVPIGGIVNLWINADDYLK